MENKIETIETATKTDPNLASLNTLEAENPVATQAELIPPVTSVCGYSQETAKEKSISDKDFKAKVAHVVKASKQIREDIQELAVQALFQMFAYDNYDRASVLIEAVRTSTHRKYSSPLVKWFTEYSPSRWVKTDDKSFTDGWKLRKDKGNNAKPFNISKAVETKWYEMTGATSEDIAEVFTSGSVLKALENLQKRIKKEIEKGHVEQADIPFLQYLETALKEVEDKGAQNFAYKSVPDTAKAA